MFRMKWYYAAPSAYTEKILFKPKILPGLPRRQSKDELQIMCVLFTEDVGGTLQLVFDAEGQSGIPDGQLRRGRSAL